MLFRKEKKTGRTFGSGTAGQRNIELELSADYGWNRILRDRTEVAAGSALGKFFLCLLQQLWLLKQVDGSGCQHLSGGQQTLVTDGSSATGNILPAVTWCLGREGDGVDLGGWNQPTDVAYVGGTGALLGAEEVRHQEIVERYRSMLAYFVHIGGNLFAFVAGIAGQVVVWHLIGCDDLLCIGNFLLGVLRNADFGKVFVQKLFEHLVRCWSSRR